MSTMETSQPEHVILDSANGPNGPESGRPAHFLPVRIPIRVCGFDSKRIEFSEDLSTGMVSATGARIALQHEVYADDTLRIINLDTYFEADFRVIGPTRMEGAQVAEWAVECSQKGRSIWGLDIASTQEESGGASAGEWLQCRACGQESLREVSLMEFEALNSTGVIAAECGQCELATYWTYADATRRPPGYPPIGQTAPPPRMDRVKKFVNTRAHRRLKLNLPILVRDPRGKAEISMTENVSIGGFAAILALDLAVGERVTYICPYATEGSQIEQQAECRWSAPTSPGGVQRIYGFRRVG